MQRHVSSSMSTAFHCPLHTIHRAQHTHPVSLRHRVTPFRAICNCKRKSNQARQRQRSCTAAASTDNGNSASADDHTFFATTPLYYVRSLSTFYALSEAFTMREDDSKSEGVLGLQVNAEPHMGSAYSTIAADAITRFQRLQGRRVAFITGTLSCLMTHMAQLSGWWLLHAPIHQQAKCFQACLRMMRDS